MKRGRRYVNVTDRVVIYPTTPIHHVKIKECVCGAEVAPWDISIANARDEVECPHCGARLFYLVKQSAVRIYQVLEADDPVADLVNLCEELLPVLLEAYGCGELAATFEWYNEKEELSGDARVRGDALGEMAAAVDRIKGGRATGHAESRAPIEASGGIPPGERRRRVIAYPSVTWGSDGAR